MPRPRRSMNYSLATPRRGRRSLSMLSASHLDITTNGMNGFIDLPRQVFSLTYLGDDETHNPDSLGSLEELKKINWKTYIVGYLYNFSYKKSEINSLAKALNRALNPLALDETNVKYVSEISLSEELSPTENDNNGLVIKVSEVQEETERNKQVFRCYLMSWCSPVKASGVMLPLLLCCGKKIICNTVLQVVSEQFDVKPQPFTLLQEDLRHLSLYSLIMLRDTDSGNATLSYKIAPGTIKLVVPLSEMLKLWSHVHQSENDEVSLEEVHTFHYALESFCETTFGFKLNCTLFQQMKVDGHFSIKRNSEIHSKSTRIIHVILKYLTDAAVQRLNVKVLERIH